MSKFYGSLNNRLDENQKEIPNIEVGMGVTEYLWSDRNAYEVVKVINQKDVIIRRYTAKHIGEYGNDEWELISDETNCEEEVVYRYGNWYKKSRSIYNDEITYQKVKLRFGVAEYYYDFEF